MAKAAVPKEVVEKLKCLQCEKILKPSKRPRRKRFCNDHCRWRWHNAERTNALKQVRAMGTTLVKAST